MIIVDTSIWVDHLRRTNSLLVELLLSGKVLGHSLVIGELACGFLKNRNEIIGLLESLPQAETVEHDEVLFFIEKNKLFGKGIGLIDIHLLASAVLEGVTLWTADKKLNDVAAKMKILYKP